MKKTKRLLSSVLVVVMVLNLMVQDITAIAAETVPQEGGAISESLEIPASDNIDDSIVTIDPNGQNDADDQTGETDESDDAGNADGTDNSGNIGEDDSSDNTGNTDGTDDADNTDGTNDNDAGTTDSTDESDDTDNTDATDNSGESDVTDETNDSGITDDSEQSDDDITDGEDQTDNEDESAIAKAEDSDWSESQYITFSDNSDGVTYKISKTQTYKTVNNIFASAKVYVVNTSDIEEIEFEASVALGRKLEIPEDLKDIISQENERKLFDRRWTYNYTIDITELSTTMDEPLEISLIKADDEVPVDVSGDVVVDGIDEDGMAQVGDVVTIEVLNAGEVLAMITQDDKGNTVYTAMELDYENRYEFTVENETAFVAANPDTVGYAIANSASNKAKLTGEKGLKLNSLASSAQGYQEIVLNFTAVPNGSDGTATESTYYEVKVAAKPKKNETVPAGSSEAPKYYYIKKTADVNTQSKSIKVNNGTGETACTYEFAVRLVHISNKTSVPNENTSRDAAIEAALSGNTIVKSFATKNLYYEDKLGFTKKTVNVYTGQSNVLTGTVKYSKNASYLHNLTAVAYNSEGGVCSDITCNFKNDNDELYVSVAKEAIPDKYTIGIYAGSVDSKTAPQSGTMYQAYTSFVLTVSAGINYIYTDDITKRVAVGNKAVTFSATPVGYGGYEYYFKAKSQKFTYEIKSFASNKVVEPTDDVKNNISVNKNGKVTIKKGYTVKAGSGEEYIAIVIKAADFAGNTTSTTVKVLVSNTVLVPTEIYLTDKSGKKIEGNSFAYDKLDNQGTYLTTSVVVLDQFGKNMNQYVTITPNKIKYNANFVYHYTNESEATLYINKLGNISIKAVTTDGNKKAKTVKFTVSMPAYKNIVYSVASVSCGGVPLVKDDDYKTANGKMNYKAPGSCEIVFNIGAATILGSAFYNRSLIDWQYSVTGGKLRFDGNYWIITTTAKTTQLEIWYKSNSFSRWTLKFTNDNWNSSTYSTAPKITLVDGNVYTNQLSIASSNSQQLTYKYDSGSFDQIAVNPTSDKVPAVKISGVTNSTFTLDFAKGNIKAGSYKYNVVFMKNKKIACKPVTITVKVKKTPKIKITASYTLKTDQADSITLKCTPSDLGISSSAKLLDANVKGKANDFSKYFTISVAKNSEGVPTATIKLKDAYKAELKGKTITGYVKYDYYLGYSHVENVTSKITIKVK
ncbi:MAG: hypothetical protein J1E98_09705 [Lachnospiraceae bacterium]|nr:hypothetical protein [Lachnospiraceae bacterium]